MSGAAHPPERRRGTSSWKPSRPSPAQRDPRPLSDSLERVTRALGGPRPSVLTAVFARWEAVVGPDIAAHARPVSLRSGVLRIDVDQPAWAAELRFLAADMLERLRETSGSTDLTEVQIRVRP